MFARNRTLAGFIGVCCLAAAALAQGRQLTADDYAQAEKFMPYNVNPLVLHTVGQINWIEDGRFWYRDVGPDGETYLLVDPAKRTRTPAFDHAKLAAALTLALAEKPDTESAPTPESKTAQDPHHLKLSEITFADSDKTVTFVSAARNFRCNLSGAGKCSEIVSAADVAAVKDPAPTDISPDNTKAVFIRDYNLWVRDLDTGKETQLTTDGVKDFGYATDNAGWQHSDKPIVLWSPDSKKIATFQQDQRKVKEMYLVPVTNRHPALEAWKYPLVGDENVTMIERVIIDVSSARVIRLKMPPDQHRSTVCDDVSCNGRGWDDVQWAPDAHTLAFVSTSRDHRQEWLRVADVATGEVREVYTESAPRFFQAGSAAGEDGRVNWRYLPQSNEFLWYSERDNWGQIYLYDLTTGKLKSQITSGDGDITQILRVDEKTRTLYLLAVGKEPGRDPYFRHFYSVSFDGKNLKHLTPEDANHAVTLSDNGRYFVDVSSRPDHPQTALVRDIEGHAVLDLEKQDISRLVAAGWKPLTPFTVKARDGQTDLYGFLFKPTNFDPARKYPIIDYVYPGPWSSSCGGRSFSAAHRDGQALAELGFIVICIDGMGTPTRSKAFEEFYSSAATLADDTIPDQVAGIKQLAARYPWIDLDRVGIWGHSGGGNATASAMFHFPDFFKVGISESGNHDNREYEDDWAEKWAGLEHKSADGTSNYDAQANQNFAKNLKGHLLLAHGTMDENVPLNNTLLVVDALIKANKDFDLILIPNAHHGYGAASQYMTRRRWDYFVRYLAGNLPPQEYEMKSYAEITAQIQNGPNPEDEFDNLLDE